MAFLSDPSVTSYYGQIVEELRFSDVNSGALLEVNIECGLEFSEGIHFGVWGNASWLKISDDGTLTAQLRPQTNAPVVIVPNSTDTDSGISTLTRYIIVGGIVAEVTF